MTATARQRAIGGILLLLAVCFAIGSILDRSTGVRGTVGRAGAFGAIVLALLAVAMVADAGIRSLGRRR